MARRNARIAFRGKSLQGSSGSSTSRGRGKPHVAEHEQEQDVLLRTVRLLSYDKKRTSEKMKKKKK
jgi:hypothetical protein